MPHCAVIGCTLPARRNEKVNSYHRIPEDEKLRRTWLTLCGRDVENENKWRDLATESNCVRRLRVCSRHFDDSDFERDLRFQLLGKWYRRRLKKDAVPHLHLAKIKTELIDVEGLDVEKSIKIKTELIDVEGSDVEESTPFFQIPVIKEVTSVEKADIKWWKLDSCDIDADQESSSQEKLSVAPAVQGPQEISSSNDVQRAPSSLPASQTWPGEYEFTVSFGFQKKSTKGIAWTYSKIADKLYVLKDSPCPINFSANTTLPDGISIRVMALYTSPEQVSDVVKRCVNHSMQEISAGIMEAEHLVRCESSMAKYHVDASTGRHSVTVPFENPPVGQHYSTYIYKFVCFGSCAGGPNRRPLMLIFTLEKGNQVIGRKKLDVKICACPGRDRKTDENQLCESKGTNHALQERTEPSQKRKEPPVELVSLSDALDFTKSVSYPPTKKSKTNPGKDGCYILNVEDKGCYEFLLQMKKFYEICKIMKDLSPDVTKALLSYQKRNLDQSE